MKVKYISNDIYEFSNEKDCTYFEEQIVELSKEKNLELITIRNKRAYVIKSLADFVWVMNKEYKEEKSLDNLYKVYNLLFVNNTYSFDFLFFPDDHKTSLKILKENQDTILKLEKEIETLSKTLEDIKKFNEEVTNVSGKRVI